MHVMRSNGWETSTRRNVETQEGITASQCNPHSRPDTRGLLIVFKRLGTREVFVRTYGTIALQGLTAPEGWYSSMSLSLNPMGATVKDMGQGCPHQPYIWTINGGSPRGLGTTTNLEIMMYQGYLPHHSYGRIELICCNQLGIQSVVPITLVVTLPLFLYKEG